MGKVNRGQTSKLNIRLSTGARAKIGKAAKNLGTSQAGVILLELSKLLKDPPSKTSILNLENKIELESDHFVVTVNEKVMSKVNLLSKEYEIRKNVLIGYILSNHFDPVEDKDFENRRIMVQLNSSLKRKMDKYSEEHFIPFSALVTYSVINGPYKGIPSYDGNEIEQFFTNVPGYIMDLKSEKAVEMNIREHLYTSLCLYKQFMTPEGRFYE